MPTKRYVKNDGISSYRSSAMVERDTPRGDA